ncbi:class I SAM-dependent methyltransferase family protein [Candidatus Micrarchaeota archaeon]|nr:class I SAM-dependent methyltransferase family protein [Candidatus Micrarchaeota archaeon]
MNLKQLLAKKIPESKMQFLGSGFDIIGDIAIVDIDENLKKYEKDIAKAIMQLHKPVKVVVKKLGAVEDRYRTRKLKIILGARRKETIYRESGVQMKVHLEKCYFSSRLATERTRISQLTQENENVLVMFAGVGPFCLVIAKEHKTAKVFGIELNPVAVRYAKENIELNKLKNIVFEKGDVRKVISKNKKYQNFADRIVMPLPHTAHEFLDSAFMAVKNGGTVHFYTLVNSENPFGEAIAKAQKAAEESDVTINVIEKRIVRPYSAKIVQVVLDIKVTKS